MTNLTEKIKEFEKTYLPVLKWLHENTDDNGEFDETPPIEYAKKDLKVITDFFTQALQDLVGEIKVERKEWLIKNATDERAMGFNQALDEINQLKKETLS